MKVRNRTPSSPRNPLAILALRQEVKALAECP